MTYQLTEHAKDALAKRQIPIEWMERAFVTPEWKESDSVDKALEHRLVHISEFDNRVLRVIVNVDVVPPRIVTVYFDRRRKQA